MDAAGTYIKESTAASTRGPHAWSLANDLQGRPSIWRSPEEGKDQT
jgi:hypothetical protein